MQYVSSGDPETEIATSITISPTTSEGSPGNTPQPAGRTPTVKVNVFSFTDYRQYLLAFYEAKKAATTSYSMSSFIRRAGLGQNSRGYLKLIIEGKRNLTPHTIRRFSEAMSLTPRETLYFENLVYFNQSKTGKDKEYYFQRLSTSAEGNETTQLEVLKSQYHYYSNWYSVAVRELVGLSDFKEDPTWISAQLRNKITKKQAAETLDHLINLGMIKRDDNDRLVQSTPLVKVKVGAFNEILHKFHLEMIDRAKESLNEDEYEQRNASCVTLSCDSSKLQEAKKMVDAFRDQLTLKCGVGAKHPDTVVQINFQIFQLTPPKKGVRKTEGKSHTTENKENDK